MSAPKHIEAPWKGYSPDLIIINMFNRSLNSHVVLVPTINKVNKSYFFEELIHFVNKKSKALSKYNTENLPIIFEINLTAKTPTSIAKKFVSEQMEEFKKYLNKTTYGKLVVEMIVTRDSETLYVFEKI